MVFAREIAGQELTFGVSGKLIMNAVVMYDHQTDSLWSQFLTKAVEGPLAGEQLELIPAPLTTWEAWVQAHPGTLLLDKRTGRGSGADPYSGYYASGDAGILGETNPDGRLYRKMFIVGLDWGAEARAYDFATLAEVQIVNEVYAGEDIVVTFDPENATQAVFSRTAPDGQTLTFEPVGNLDMRDAETGSTWVRATGVAVNGPLEGTRLGQRRSFVSFWFAWTDFHPGTELYEAPAAESP